MTKTTNINNRRNKENKKNAQKSLRTGSKLLFPAGKKRRVGNPSDCNNKTDKRMLFR